MINKKPLVSVIIPSFERFNYLLRSINSIENQTFKDFEIIIVNDRSSDQNYYNYNWSGVKILHLKENTKKIIGHACAGYARNYGAKFSQGKYLAFCDDDDVWHPQKLETQINEISKTKHRICCTNSFISLGKFSVKKDHPTYFERHKYLHKKGIPIHDIPRVWDEIILDKHNIVSTSSVLMEKFLFERLKGFNLLPNGQEDYDLWKRCLNFSNILYIPDPLIYYDTNHGDGRMY